MYWYLVILILMLYPLSLASMGYFRKINLNKLTIPISLGILLFFMGCRAVEVGADTCQYVYGFQQICRIPFSALFKTPVFGIGGGYELEFEYGYLILNKLVSYVSSNDQAITIANSILIIFLMARLLKKRSAYPILSIWLYITLGIFQTQMNMARNAIAIFCCYLALQQIEKKKPVRYLLAILVATLIHTSSILFIPLYWLINSVELTPKLVKRILLIAVIFGFGFSLVKPIAIRILPYELGRYLMGNTTKLESLFVSVFHLSLVAVTLGILEKSKRNFAVKKEKIGIWMLVAETFFFCVGYDVSAATRMAALYGPYLIVSIPNLLGQGIKSDKKRLVAIIFIIILTGVQYVLRLQINNIGGTIPYQFFWT